MKKFIEWLDSRASIRTTNDAMSLLVNFEPGNLQSVLNNPPSIEFTHKQLDLLANSPLAQGSPELHQLLIGGNESLSSYIADYQNAYVAKNSNAMKQAGSKIRAILNRIRSLLGALRDVPDQQAITNPNLMPKNL